MTKTNSVYNRRKLLAVGLTNITVPMALRAEAFRTTRRNTSSCQSCHWKDHFVNLGTGANFADIESRALPYRGPIVNRITFCRLQYLGPKSLRRAGTHAS